MLHHMATICVIDQRYPYVSVTGAQSGLCTGTLCPDHIDTLVSLHICEQTYLDILVTVSSVSATRKESFYDLQEEVMCDLRTGES